MSNERPTRGPSAGMADLVGEGYAAYFGTRKRGRIPEEAAKGSTLHTGSACQ
jgi:hypothetical protein